MLPDCPIIADIRLRSRARNAILSIHPAWLDACLQVVIGEGNMEASVGGKVWEEYIFGDPLVLLSFGYKRFVSE